ncbi:MAG: ribosome biogenesis GTP-binding protein YsxC [Candidatus Kerfeldbacteria bacterium]|nr:ribosome biogenesis GTP-binding protein YsxC [Candidatus Kerfeldbacteria bacterium]
MNITSAKFIRGIVGEDPLLSDGIPQVAFIGRSNVGKSSIINALTKQKKLAITSSSPGRTQQINVYLINKAVYMMDMPGYGYAKAPQAVKEELRELIHWYFFASPYDRPKVVFIIDAEVGITKNDIEMFRAIADQHKHIVVVANKVDKIKPSQYTQKIEHIEHALGQYKIIPFSSKKGIGVNELTDEILTTEKD